MVFAIMAHPSGDEYMNYMLTRGAVVIEGKGVIIPSRCPHLQYSETDPNKYFCDIFEERPFYCRNARGLNFYHPPGCTDE